MAEICDAMEEAANCFEYRYPIKLQTTDIVHGKVNSNFCSSQNVFKSFQLLRYAWREEMDRADFSKCLHVWLRYNSDETECWLVAVSAMGQLFWPPEI